MSGSKGGRAKRKAQSALDTIRTRRRESGATAAAAIPDYDRQRIVMQSPSPASPRMEFQREVPRPVIFRRTIQQDTQQEYEQLARHEQQRHGLGRESHHNQHHQQQPLHLHRIPQQPQQHDSALEDVSKLLTLDFWTNDRTKIRSALCKLIKFCRSPAAKENVASVEQLGIHAVVLGALQHYRDSGCKDIMIFGCGVLSLLLNLSNAYHAGVADVSSVGNISSNSSTHSSLSDFTTFTSNSNFSGSHIPVGLMGGVDLALCVLNRHAEDAHLPIAGCKLLLSLLQANDRAGNAARLLAADGLTVLCQTMTAVAHDVRLQAAACGVLVELCRINDTEYPRRIILAGGMVRASIAIQAHPHDADLQHAACRLMTRLVQTMSTTGSGRRHSSTRQRTEADM